MSVRILVGDAREKLRDLPAESVHCVVTSPPYWGLRAYRGDAGMIGLELTFDEHLANLVAVFREVRRVLRKDGTLWLNYGDAYASGMRSYYATDRKYGQARAHDSRAPTPPGLKPKDLLMMPARVALALQADGWWLRSEIVWHKPNPMPESVTDRPTSAHEKVYLLSKSKSYFYDAEAVRQPLTGGAHARRSDGERLPAKGTEDGDNRTGTWKENYTPSSANLRNVWTIATSPFSEWTQTTALVPLSASQVPGHGASDSAIGGDICRITSRDCPVHAGQSDRVPRGFCDGLSEAQMRHIHGSDGHPERARLGAAGGGELIHGQDSLRPSTTDSPAREDFRSATSRSTESRRTDLDRQSSPHATSCEGTSCGTGRTEHQQSPLASTSHDIDGSRIADGRTASPEPRTAGGSARNVESGPSCQCAYYRKVREKTSHFATFPPALVEPCIKAGTSEKGVCGECGAPWIRHTESYRTLDGERCEGLGSMWTGDEGRGESKQGVGHWRIGTKRECTGWHAICSHEGADPPRPIPATVLDPFGGAGTVGLVADRLQRDAILIEISPEYAAMAERRIRGDAPLFSEVRAS